MSFGEPLNITGKFWRAPKCKRRGSSVSANSANARENCDSWGISLRLSHPRIRRKATSDPSRSSNCRVVLMLWTAFATKAGAIARLARENRNSFPSVARGNDKKTPTTASAERQVLGLPHGYEKQRNSRNKRRLIKHTNHTPTLFNKKSMCSSKLTMMAESRDYWPNGVIANRQKQQLLKYDLITSIYFATQ